MTQTESLTTGVWERRGDSFRKALAFAIAAGLVFASCATVKNGYYQYDFVRTFKGIEDEWNFAQNYGMKMVQELTLEQTGTVTWFESGILYDPVLQISLTIDRGGVITSTDNVSVRGVLQRNKKFYWSGLIEQHGRLNSVFVSGTLIPLPRSVRAGREYDGIYHITDSGTGKAQLVRISDGFYTWRFADDSDPGWTPWPTLVHPNGEFAFSMNMTTVMQMGEQKTSFTTGFTAQGTVNAGKSLMVEEYTQSAGTLINNPVQSAPLIYSGNMVRAGAYPAEALPADMPHIINARKAAADSPKKHSINYPEWYLFPPHNNDKVYAAGEKTFADETTALALAEAAAAARIAEYIRVHVISTTTGIETETSHSFEEQIKTQSVEQVPYKVVKSEYDKTSSTAFVLIEYNEK
jgi:hypothetical protein